MIISISGTPGTGKHTIARELAKKLDYRIIDSNELLRGKYEVSIKELNAAVGPELKDNSIIVSHMGHFLKSKKVDLFIIIRCDPMRLKKRLEKRGYSKEKVHDNILFEALDGSYIESASIHKNTIQVDNTKNIERTIKELVGYITKKRQIKKFRSNYIKQLIKIENMNRQ